MDLNTMPKTYTALIVDDERLARESIIAMLSEFNNIQVVGEASSLASTVQAVEELHPDVIFLDIQIPGGSAFELLEKVQNKSKIIFVTAYNEYAAQAFDVNAVDYLVKPVSHKRLSLSIAKLASLNDDIDSSAPTESSRLKYGDSLFITMDNSWRFLKIRSIVVINAAGDYTKVFTSDGNAQMTKKSLREWESRLPQNYFARIHRSTIVNIDYIERTEGWFNYSCRVFLKGIEKPFLISRRYVSRLKDLFS
jgi:two-component system LytT family response regulator